MKSNSVEGLSFERELCQNNAFWIKENANFSSASRDQNKEELKEGNLDSAEGHCEASGSFVQYPSIYVSVLNSMLKNAGEQKIDIIRHSTKAGGIFQDYFSSAP